MKAGVAGDQVGQQNGLRIADANHSSLVLIMLQSERNTIPVAVQGAYWKRELEGALLRDNPILPGTSGMIPIREMTCTCQRRRQRTSSGCTVQRC